MERAIPILTKTFLKLDYRDKDNSGKKKVIGILLAYTFSNFFLSFANAGAFDEQSFVILSLSTNIFFLAFVALTDFNNIFFSKSGYELISALPVKDSEIFISKFFSGFLYIAFFSAAIILPQSFWLYRYSESISHLVLFILACFLFNIFFVCILLLLFSFATGRFKEKASLFVYVLQFGFVIFVIFSTSLTSKARLDRQHSLLAYDAVHYLPQYLYSNILYNPVLLAVCSAASLGVLALFYFYISRNYRALSDIINAAKKKTKKKALRTAPGFRQRIIDKYILKNNFETASYYLLKNQLANSRTLKLRYIPLLFFPLLFCAAGLLPEFSSFMIFTPGGKTSFFETVVPLLSPTITFSLIMCVRLLLTNTKISEESSPDTLWIYNTLPIPEKKFINNGIKKFVYVNFLFPVIFIIFFILSYKLALLSVALNIGYITVCIIFINSIMEMFSKTYPFTLESTRFNSAQKFVEILFTILLGIAVFVSQLFIFQNVIFVVAAVIILASITALLNRK